MADRMERDFDHVRNPVAARWRAGPRASCGMRGGRRGGRAGRRGRRSSRWPRAWGSAGRDRAGAAGARRAVRTRTWSEAVARARGRRPCALELAKALLAVGRRHRLARRPTEAREPLRRALEVAVACGATGLTEAIRAELAAAGARPRTDALSGPAALTPSERRVATLAADGLTNRDIAAAAVRDPEDDRGPPQRRLPQARHRLAPRARRRARRLVAKGTVPDRLRWGPDPILGVILGCVLDGRGPLVARVIATMQPQHLIATPRSSFAHWRRPPSQAATSPTTATRSSSRPRPARRTSSPSAARRPASVSISDSGACLLASRPAAASSWTRVPDPVRRARAARGRLRRR